MEHFKAFRALSGLQSMLQLQLISHYLYYFRNISFRLCEQY